MSTLKKLVFFGASILFSAQSWALNVFACEPEWAALAKELAPEANIYSATNAYQDPHYIEARPSLIAKARKADLLVCTGAELEVGWLPVLLRQGGNPKIQSDQPGYLMASDQVERLEIPTGKISRSMGDIHASGNPHVNLDPHRMLQIAEVMRDRLVTIDAANTEQYRQNFVDFAGRWAKATEQWEQQAAVLKGAQYVSYHKDFSYFADWLGLKLAATLEPKPGVPPSAKHVQMLYQQLAEQDIVAVIITSAQPSKNAKRFAKKVDRPLVVAPLSPGAEGADDLFAQFQLIIDRLVAAKQG